MNPEPFLQLDRVIHEKGRLGIMSLLASMPACAFTELRDTLQMSDGNLTTHLRTLHEAGLVSFTRSMETGRATTTYSLTERGRKAFTEYLDLLEAIVRQNRPT